MDKVGALKKELNNLADKTQAEILRRFFKTGPGEYGQGDIFLGIKVSTQRQVAKKYPDLKLKELQVLLNSKIHGYRFTALLILVDKYVKADTKNKQSIFDFYLKNSKNINNWDLVDLTAPKIAGDYFLDKPRKILYELAGSGSLWERRIAIVATYAFIRNNDFKDTLKISEILLNDSHDLIHKAVGWMLREVGKRDLKVEEEFLKKYYKDMPRVMLRYAIEKFSEKKRKYYLHTNYLNKK
ncbi:DNA alkylation repair protein [Candidatus Falkowbacteria bacterium]|nr:MAG: DNA alkylation repair protein [Candidatus Falkowbacteria bacterium]